MRIAIAACALALFGTSALAETPVNNDAQALEALKLFASCAVQRTPDGARKILALDPNGEAYQKASSAYARGHSMCLRGNSKLKFASLPFAGFLAEALLVREAAVSTGDTGAKPVSTENWVEAVGACVAVQKPAEVSSVFATVPGSDAETAALNPTGEALRGCIREGQTVALNRAAVRAMYALGAYRLSHPIQSKSEG